MPGTSQNQGTTGQFPRNVDQRQYFDIGHGGLCQSDRECHLAPVDCIAHGDDELLVRSYRSFDYDDLSQLLFRSDV